MNNLHFDVNITSQCNFRCVYCFEHGKYQDVKLNNPDLLIYRITQLINREEFKNKFQRLTVSFWGGEPLLEFDTIKYICEHLKHYDCIRFLLYTNGSLLHKHIDYFNSLQKITIQVSYDGEPIHTLCRKSCEGNNTAQIIYDILEKNKEYNFDLSLKSTLPLQHLDKIYDAYSDVKNIVQKYELKHIDYMPTIDYCQSKIDLIPEHDFNLFKQGLLKIAKDELTYYKENNKFFFKWFNDNTRHLCTAAIYLYGIDTDLSVYRCHGDFYNDDIVKSQLKITNLADNTWFDDILNIHDLHKEYSNFEPINCLSCKSTYCMRCNSFKYRHSKKTSLLEKWYDYDCQPGLCTLFNLVGDIKRGVNKILGRY